ncbi:PAS domain S-box protein [Gimesia panareensis]|uniref:histidine kinase n=1 Tax=Gimesia panareensis TaxID=2527978 RepID=A0A518A9S6_9PLAN|nr:PAS domain S-box protein [Gimesia panareensis]QDT28609.1 Sensor protein FixL [Gimesia panareensis]QDU51468.1 Sensor protein FixL [Gimesia panareensis]
MDQTESQDHASLASRFLSETFPELQNRDFLDHLSDVNHQLLRKILSITPLIIWAVDREGIVTLSEGGGLTKLGYEPGEWVGKSIFKEFADDAELIDLFNRTLSGEKNHLVRTVGAQTLDVEYTPLYNDEQQVDGFLSVAVDISEKVASEEELRRSEERFSTIFQVNPIAMCITEIDTGIFIEVNENFLTALQCTREEILGKSAFDIGFWPSKETRREMIEKVKNEGTAKELYFDFIIPNGTRLCTMLSAVQIYFRGETFLLSCVKDVTRERAALDELEKLNEHLEARVASRTAELQQAHASLNEEYTKRNRLYRALQQTEARWRSLVTNAPDTILTVDIDGTILYLNHPIAGQKMEKVIGASIYQFMNPGDIEKAKAILQEVFQTGKPQEMETEGVSRAGYKYVYSCRVGAMVSGGITVAAMVIATNITHQKLAEQELVRRRAELAHLSRLSTMGELAAELSHELNQPLAAINNYTNGCIRRIRLGTTSLDNLIEPLEEMSRQAQRASETIKRLRRHVQKSEVEHKKLDINLVIENSIALLEHEIQRNFVSLHLELSPEPLHTIGDAIQLEQVLVNLLLNAIEAMSEFPPEQRKLVIESDRDAHQNLVICVTDSGIGLKKGEENSIFETFYTTKQKGLGVGLSISQTIIEAHGGKLYPRRNKQGTSFFITLPLVNGDNNGGG